MIGRVIVTNAGTHPELAHLAAELGQRGHLAKYFTTLGLPADGLLARATSLPPPAGSLVKRRILPEGLSRSSVRLVATARELAYLRSRDEVSIGRRNDEFQRRVAAELRQTAAEVLVAQKTNALGVFRSAHPDVVKVLNYPIAHHRWMVEQMSKEAARNPGWARHLQHHDTPESMLRRLDDEVEEADYVLVGSSFVRNTFLHVGVPEGKLRVTPYGADIRALGVSPGHAPKSVTFTVVFVGQINQRKGISYLLDAFSRAAVPNARLLLLGRASRDILHDLSQYSGVKYLGHLPRTRLGEVVSRAHVLALPSLAEGFSLATIEAMAAGTTVIASPYSFGYDVIKEGVDGFIREPWDVEGFVQALRLLAHHPERAALMGQAAATKARSFSWSTYRKRAADTILGFMP